jgi:hypothetical protein
VVRVKMKHLSLECERADDIHDEAPDDATSRCSTVANCWRNDFYLVYFNPQTMAPSFVMHCIVRNMPLPVLVDMVDTILHTKLR